jgi:hypothetical protein
MDDLELPATLRTSIVTILNRNQCIAHVSNIRGSYINIEEKFMCSFNSPQTLLEMVSNNIFYVNILRLKYFTIATC